MGNDMHDYITAFGTGLKELLMIDEKEKENR